MRLLVLDFETYFDKEYSLDKMTTEEYIRDPRFEAQVLCARWYGTHEVIRCGKETIANFLNGQDWSQVCILAHHAAFDAGILSLCFGIRPAGVMCSMSMARFVYGPQKKASLAALAERIGIGQKTVPYKEVKGHRWAAMPIEMKRKLVDGCAQDVNLTYTVYEHLRPCVPVSELNLIDMTVRMFTEPCLNADVGELEAYAREETEKRDALLKELGVTAADLASNDKFAALLESEGLEVPRKEGKNGLIPAVAASDAFMKELADYDDDRVRTLANARIATKSTIHRTRAERISGMAQRGGVTVYLNYFGAHTSRWSGGDRCNFQNLPSRSVIRHALRAPKGNVLVVVDAAQIEARIVNFLAGQDEVIDWFRQGRDPYRELAVKLSGLPESEIDDSIRKRYKIVFLGSGYGMGAVKMVATMRKFGVTVTLEWAQEAIQGYRRVHNRVKNYWYECDGAIWSLYDANYGSVELGPEIVGGHGVIHLPEGVDMHYELRRDGNNWLMKAKDGWRHVWGGTVTENIVQGVARVQFGQAIMNVFKRTGVRPALLCHDEGVWAVPAGEAEAFRDIAVEEMSRPIRALAGCPLGASWAIDERYTKP